MSRWTGPGSPGKDARVHRSRSSLRTAAAIAVIVVLTGCTAPPSGPLNPTTTAPVPTSTVQATGPGPGTAVLVPQTTVVEAPAGTEVPAAARLAWLSGKPATPAVELQVADAVRWQGTVPGEYALLEGTGYEWFGADGAMVGCAGSGRCVGIDAQGFTAVELAAGTTRAVYRPDGRFLGLFDTAGRPAEGTAPTMSAAIDSTGVDLARLVDRSSRPVPFAGGVTGDPHLLTTGRVRLSSQVTGEFYARYGDPEREIQLRTEPMPHRRDAAIVTAVALSAAGSRVEFTDDGRLTLDGATVPTTAAFRQISITGGPELGRWPQDAQRVSHLAVVWPDGGSVVVTATPSLGLTVVAQLPPRAGVSGLFGTGEGVDDLRDRRGVLGDDPAVVESWRLGGLDRSLFDERIDPVDGFPESVAAPPPEAVAAADRACQAAGVTPIANRSACTFDVALTGDDGFALGHARMVIPAERAQVPPGLAARWPALAAGATEASTELPSGGRIGGELSVGEHRVYRLNVARAGAIGLQQAPACPAGSSGGVAQGRAALRVFGTDDWAVSPRLPLCGAASTQTLQPGRYLLVIDGATTGAPAPVDLQVTLP